MKKRDSVAGTALDPVVKFTPLEVDGETFHLSYDFNAIAKAEKVAECNLLQGMAAVLLNGMTALQLRGLLYAATQKAHPKMTIDQCGNLIRVDTMPDIHLAILKAYNESLPEAHKILKDPTESGDEPLVA